MSSPDIDAILPYLSEIRIPNSNDKIYKDECVYSYDTPESPNGIYVCLKTFLGFSRKFVELQHAKTGNAIYLNLKRIANPVKNVSCDDQKSKITKLAINMEGGFNTNDKQVEYEEVNNIVILPNFKEIQLNLPNLPDKLIMCVSNILAADSASKQEELESLQGTWDGEKRFVSKHSENLVQLDNGVRVPPSGWKCQNCDIRDGLWLNLTDGSIHCGRKYFDGTGGNNHASEHFKETKYPLVVKLGTITPNGADVYSYDEDAMVEDPKLAQHLAHFGINISNCQKTEKSMIEMEIDLNKRYDEWSIIQEDGCQLKSLFGPGFTGLANLGNSCYLNSVMQVLFSIPDFVKEYYRADKNVQFNESNTCNPPGDLKTQLMKLASGLLTGEYSVFGQNINEQIGIKPRMFKNLIGRNNAEFMSKRQQDAQEFFLYVIDLIERLHVGEGKSPPTDCFKFQIEERVECGESKKVKYTNRSEFILSLPISNVPVQNKEEYDAYVTAKEQIEKEGGQMDSKQKVLPIIKLTDCIHSFFSQVRIDDFFSNAVKRKTFATMTTRLSTFPDYLVIHVKKFTLGNDWVPKKLDVSLDVPDVIELEKFRGKGKQENEEELPDSRPNSPVSNAPQQAAEFEISNDLLNQLKDMGFPVEASKRALYHTNNNIEAATSWIFEHSNESDFNTPFTPAAPSSNDNNPMDVAVDNEALANILLMGLEERHARIALKLNNNNTERAIEWIFANSNQIDAIEQEMLQKQRAASVALSSQQKTFRDGVGRYELVAFVSHMGTSTFCGHYVSHIKKQVPDNQNNERSEATTTTKWTIFNDNKVAISEKPPKQFAYMYLYKRIQN